MSNRSVLLVAVFWYAVSLIAAAGQDQLYLDPTDLVIRYGFAALIFTAITYALVRVARAVRARG